MKKGFIDDWDAVKHKGWITSSDGFLYFPERALCNTTVPKAGQQCFYRVGQNVHGDYAAHVFILTGATGEPSV
jgi:hypothetical protein